MECVSYRLRSLCRFQSAIVITECASKTSVPSTHLFSHDFGGGVVKFSRQNQGSVLLLPVLPLHLHFRTHLGVPHRIGSLHARIVTSIPHSASQLPHSHPGAFTQKSVRFVPESSLPFRTPHSNFRIQHSGPEWTRTTDPCVISTVL